MSNYTDKFILNTQVKKNIFQTIFKLNISGLNLV